MTNKGMDPRVKALWVSALKSGEYKQGKLRLKAMDRFCCLGVLCDLYAKETPGVEWEVKKPDWDSATILNARNILPKQVVEWAGLVPFCSTTEYGSNKPAICGDPTLPTAIYLEREKRNTQSLIGLNDTGWDFKSIAQVIEEQL